MSFSKFLDPKYDLTFKRIFGSEKNKEILIHFLNDILLNNTLAPLNLHRIKEVKFLTTIQDPDIAAKKQLMCYVKWSSIYHRDADI